MSRITSIETSIPSGIMPNLLLVRIHTDDGLVGCGETYYTPHAIASLIHDWMAERLLGADALAVESHWRFLYERCTPFGHPGAEMRALTAGPLQDNWSSHFAAGDLAEELVAEGIPALKLWPFDRAAHRNGGLHISWADIEEAMKPLRAIRERVGMKLEIAIEGHGFFHLPAALRIAEALREIKPLWLEDVLRVDNIATLADFRRRSGLPIAASEMLLGRKEYLTLLQAQGCDYCMVDPTWSGGISETRRVIDLAQSFNVPSTIHDCTGPLTLFSGLHLAAASTNVVFQESVRAHIRSFYDKLVDTLPVIEQGKAQLPTGTGLGTRLREELFQPGVNAYRRSDAS